MNNQGKITVFLCLLLTSLLMLGLTIIDVVRVHSARGKITMCARAAMYNIRAEYNSYIFEHYHILLFDMNQGGKGEAYLEEKIIKDMEENLGEGFVVENCAITEYTNLADNDCQKLKEQIGEYFLYGAIEDVSESITDATEGEDGTLPDELIQEMEAVENGDSGTLENSVEENVEIWETDLDVESESSGNETVENEDEAETSAGVGIAVDDPRDYASGLDMFGLIYVVVPEGMSVSSKVINISELPSYDMKFNMDEIFGINDKFDDMDDMESDLESHSTWIDALGDMGVGISYAKKVFNSATDGNKNEATVFAFEMEYLICGKASDKENLETVVSKIIALRLPINYAYLVSDTRKMSEVSGVATPLSIFTGVPQPVLKYLLAGCWSYVESIVEMRALLEGKTLPFKKDATNWVTDFSNLEASEYETAFEDEKGLDYEDYLCILLALKGDKIYGRMLDLIQLNTCEHSGKIDILKCGVDISVDLSVSYDGGKKDFNISVGY